MQSMSLVLRKAVLPKNVSLLKYFKGRPLATAANKKNIGVLSTVVPLRNLDKAEPLPEGTVKTENTKLPPPNLGCGRSEAPQLRICVSSPHIVPISRTRSGASSNLSGYTQPIHSPMLLAHRTGSTPCLVPCSLFHTTYGHFKCKPPCPCPCPCPGPPCGKCPFPCGPCGCPKGCNCLPPPCNTPPKCIQYMTGYYYYPYGVWFCGPYHVTGTCVPGGPCSPCGCGPCPGPPCPGPCPPPSGPCCPCPKCCACLSPISPVAVSGDPEPRCKSVSSQEYKGSITTPIAFCEQDRKRDSPSHSPTRTKSGISKFFPFNAVPSFPVKRMPHTTVPVCPYSTQPAPQPSSTSQEHTVYCVHSIETDYGRALLPSNHPRSSQNTKAEKSSSYSTYSSDQAKNAENSNAPIRLNHSYMRRKYQQDICPVLESPRGLVSKEQRDRPVIFPGTFQYTNIPHYKRPFYPSTPGH